MESSLTCVEDLNSDRGLGTDTRKQDGKVDVKELLEFVFPTALQHPLSTGRLYAFGMYGPLDENTKLRAGHNGKRVVSAWEIDTMCLQFEREDILQVYISGGRPLYILSEAQKEEVIAQADSHLKTAKGRGYRRQVTRAEVVQLLSSLPRDAAGLVSFHDAQQLILGYRESQIERFRVIFPDVTTAAPRLANNMRRGDNATGLTANGGGSSTARYGTAEGDRGGSHDGGSIATTVEGPVGPTALARRPLQERSREGEGGGRRRAKFSADVAPPEMFVKDVGFTPAAMAKNTNKLLSTRAYKVCNITDGNDPGLTQNVRLIREDRPLASGQGAWDPCACLRGYNIGGHVRSARSSTTVKRKA